MNPKVKTSSLSAAWERLETVCRKLWDENSSNAVEAQAVVEEFKGEVHRVDTYLANAEEMHALEADVRAGTVSPTAAAQRILKRFLG